MKSLRFVLFGSAAALSFGCSDTAPTDGAALGGASSGGSSQGGASLGGASQGGALASGGAVTSAGAPGAGGANAAGGAVSAGGAVGSGGAAAGSSSTGGQSAAGAAQGGAAGNTSSSGGRAGSGGAAQGGNSSGGAAGAPGSGGAAGAMSDTTLAGTFDGALITYPCGTGHGGFDCDNVGCTNGQVTHSSKFTLGGDASTVYELTFHVYGVVEVYNYVGGTRDAGNASVLTNPDLFLRGGAAQPNGASGYDYDVYQLDVTPPVSGSPATYFLNSVTSAENPHSSNTTLHLTFPIDYTKTIRVQGGGAITVKQFDSNCKSVMNCGKTAGNSCAAPRSIPISDAMPAAPASFSQPYQMPMGAYGQWLFFDVKSVVPAK